MIVDRFEPVNLSELIPELRLEMEPSLQALDRLLDDDEIFLRIKADLSKRHPNSESLGQGSIQGGLRAAHRRCPGKLEAGQQGATDAPFGGGAPGRRKAGR
jgi:hypothetical protein